VVAEFEPQFESAARKFERIKRFADRAILRAYPPGPEAGPGGTVYLKPVDANS
jgi:hypothetical protein